MLKYLAIPLAALLVGCSTPGVRQATTMTDPVLIGYHQYCQRNRGEPECGAAAAVVDRMPVLSDLDDVNSAVNAAVTYKTDKEHYGQVDYWSRPTDGFGDCEDYALEKLHRLLALGWKIDNLRIAIGHPHSPGIDSRYLTRHAVLIAEYNGVEYVLDNMQHLSMSPKFEIARVDGVYRKADTLEMVFYIMQTPGKQMFVAR